MQLLDKMYKYKMDPTRTVGATEQTQDAGRTEGRTYRRTDGQMDIVKPIYPQQLRCAAGIKTIDHSDVVGASPVGAAPTTSSFST